jgi:PKD repeat protein
MGAAALVAITLGISTLFNQPGPDTKLSTTAVLTKNTPTDSKNTAQNLQKNKTDLIGSHKLNAHNDNTTSLNAASKASENDFVLTNERITNDKLPQPENEGINTEKKSEDEGNDLYIPEKNDEVANVQNDIPNDTNKNQNNLSAEFSMSNSETCQFSPIKFNPKVIQGNMVYHWNFGDGQSSEKIAPEHEYDKTGEFNVVLQIIDSKTNELIAKTEKLVKVNEAPDVNFEWTKNIDAIPTISFSKKLKMNDNLLWNIDGRVLADKAEFEHTFRDAGKHKVTLIANNEFGCTSQMTKDIEIEGEDYNLFAPSAFTPDENVNNRFIPKALTLLDNPFTMNIYNQNGDLIYDTNNADMGWDGVNGLDNSAAPGGTYVWIVVLENNNGVKETYKGTFILFR